MAGWAMADGSIVTIRRRIETAFDGPGVSPETTHGPAWEEAPGQESPHRAAAVLIPLVDRHDGMTVMLTRRTEHLRSHAGQISFPGGRMEDTDPTPEETALRETEEEIGLPRSDIQLLGRMGVRQTGTGYRVVPIVGLIEPPFEVVPDPSEVAEIFEVPLDFVLDPANHRFETRILQGVERQFYVLPYRDYYIWGLTARLLVTLYETLGSETMRPKGSQAGASGRQ